MSGRKRETRLTEEEQKLKERIMRAGGGVRKNGTGRVSEEFWKMPKPKVSKGAALKALLDDRREER